jgi:hypothetical protein
MESLTEKLMRNSKDLRFLFFNKPKYNLIKLEEPRDIDTFYLILKTVYNVPSGNSLNYDALTKKYNEYLSLFSSFDFSKKRILGKDVFTNFSNVNTSLNFYLDRCHTLESAKEKLRKRQSTFSLQSFIDRYGESTGTSQYNSAINKGQLTLKSREDITKINHRKGGVNRIEFYLDKINTITNKFYTEDEAKQIVFKKQSNASKSRWEYYKKGLTDYLPNTCLDYYLKLGMNLDDALIALHKRQSLTSLDSYIYRYGEEDGIEKYNKRIYLWKTTMNSKSDDELKKIKISQRENLKYSSNASYKFFNNIITKLNNEGINFDKIYFGKKEYFIYDNVKKRIFFYDFVIPDINYACEYNGHKFHADPRIDETKKSYWRSLFTNKTYNECLEFDFYKNNLLKNKGFDLDIVWDYDCAELKTNTIINNIKNKICIQKNL